MSNFRSNNMRGPQQPQRTPRGQMQHHVPTPCYGQGDDPLRNTPLAMAYVPWQQWREIYEPDKALCRGTIFKELDKPFLGKGGGRK